MLAAVGNRGGCAKIDVGHGVSFESEGCFQRDGLSEDSARLTQKISGHAYIPGRRTYSNQVYTCTPNVMFEHYPVYLRVYPAHYAGGREGGETEKITERPLFYP